MNINFPVKISGKLNLTPEEAEDLFGFKMAKGATAVVLQVRVGKQIIQNYYPRTYFSTPKLKMCRFSFTALAHIGKERSNNLIKPIWNPISNPNTFGYQNFLGTNLKLLGNPPRWENLLVTKGSLSPPSVQSIIRWHGIIKVKLRCKESIGMCILRLSDYNLYHYPANLKGSTYFKFFIPNDFRSNTIFYFYRRFGVRYSNSISKRLKKDPGRWNYGKI